MRLEVDVCPEKLDPGVDPKQDKLTLFMAEELASFHEATAVIERHARNNNPSQLTVEQVNELMKFRRGKGWGTWETRKDEIRLNVTTGDLIDMNVLDADYRDHLAIHEWYLSYRKRRLKSVVRYAEDPNLTLEQFQSMNEKNTEEAVQSVPRPEALTTSAKLMIKEAEARPDQISALLTKTLEAKEALYAAMNELGETVHGFKHHTNEYSKDLHAFKSSVILDLGAAKKEMADVRKFFLEKEHVTEIERLKEFLDLCDRFKKLKDEGVLDVITDCILKLEGA